MDLVFGKSSRNYEEFVQKGIYLSYSYSEVDNLGYAMISSDVYDSEMFFNLIDEALNSKIDEKDFEKYRKKYLGVSIRTLNSVDGFSRNIVDSYLNNISIEDILRAVETLTYDELLDYSRFLFNDNNRTKVVVEK